MRNEKECLPVLVVGMSMLLGSCSKVSTTKESESDITTTTTSAVTATETTIESSDNNGNSQDALLNNYKNYVESFCYLDNCIEVQDFKHNEYDDVLHVAITLRKT